MGVGLGRFMAEASGNSCFKLPYETTSSDNAACHGHSSLQCGLPPKHGWRSAVTNSQQIAILAPTPPHRRAVLLWEVKTLLAASFELSVLIPRLAGADSSS